MVTLCQKLKMQKNVLKTFLQDIAVVLCTKRLEKPANIIKDSKNETTLKKGKNGHQGKAILFVKWSLWEKY